MLGELERPGWHCWWRSQVGACSVTGTGVRHLRGSSWRWQGVLTSAGLLACHRLLFTPFCVPWGCSDTRWPRRDRPLLSCFHQCGRIGVLKEISECTLSLPPWRALPYSVSLFLKHTFHQCPGGWHNCQAARSALMPVTVLSLWRILALWQADESLGGEGD